MYEVYCDVLDQYPCEPVGYNHLFASRELAKAYVERYLHRPIDWRDYLDGSSAWVDIGTGYCRVILRRIPTITTEAELDALFDH